MEKLCHTTKHYPKVTKIVTMIKIVIEDVWEKHK